MIKTTLEENIKLSLDKVNELIDFYSLAPEKDMEILETEVAKLCEYIKNTIPNKSDLLVKSSLNKLILKVEQLEKIIKTQQEEVTNQLKKLNTNSKGYSAYNKIISNNTENNDSTIH